MPVPMEILSLKFSPPPLLVWMDEEDRVDDDDIYGGLLTELDVEEDRVDDDNEDGELLTELDVEGLETPRSVVVVPAAADEVGGNELLGD
jgi:hypothetical protein